MKRIFLTIGIIVFAFSFAMAQITIDGNPSEWTGTPPVNNNSWKYSYATAGGLNEWIWKDAAGDERTDFSNPDKRVDIIEVRIASDGNYLYFLVKMNDIDLTTGNGAPMIQISIDRDRISGSGQEWLGHYPDTKVSDNAYWEYLIVTRFGSGNFNLKRWDSNWNWVDTGEVAILAEYDVIEGKIPWNAIGGTPNNSTLRFTFSSYRANTSDNTWDIGGSQTSNALDCITTTGSNTWDEVQDSVIDYYVDIEFLNDQTLPVQSVLVSAISGDSKVTLVWETRSEFDNAGFEIFRKAQDETEHKLISSYTTNDALKGLGTSPYGKRYTYVDYNVRNGVEYEYKIYAVSFSGQRQEIGVVFAKPGSELPDKFVLYQNYPNPFNPGTEIKFDLPESGYVKLEVFNAIGERVSILYDGYMEAGYSKTIRWNASGLPSGVYFYKLTAGKFVDVKKMVLVR